jgi:hypothetical protein
LSNDVLEKMMARLKDLDQWVRVAALEVLRRRSSLSDDILEKVVARLEDQDQWVREAALEVLRGQPSLSDDILEKVVARFCCQQLDGFASLGVYIPSVLSCQTKWIR